MYDHEDSREGEEGYCPNSPDGEHEPDPETVFAPDGYEVKAEKALVLSFECIHCGAPGAGVVRLKDVMW